MFCLTVLELVFSDVFMTVVSRISTHITQLVALMVISNYSVIYATQWDVQDTKIVISAH
jgi:hypothetical protein